MLTSVFEAGMLLCFGVSWPISVYKDIQSGTAKGKSVVFIFAIIIGYLCGIGGKLAGHFLENRAINYVFFLYIFNLCMVTADLLITLRNMKKDKEGATP